MTFKNLRRAALILPAFALILGAAVACGGDDADAGDSTTRPTVDHPDIPAGAPAVDQKSLKFIPSKLTVSAGETVYFVNSETAVHNVAVNGKDVTGVMRRNDVFAWTAEKPGEYKLTCDFHPQMKSTVIVE
jgi:plastocyanin